jgi:hypothetical protein
MGRLPRLGRGSAVKKISCHDARTVFSFLHSPRYVTTEPHLPPSEDIICSIQAIVAAQSGEQARGGDKDDDDDDEFGW